MAEAAEIEDEDDDAEDASDDDEGDDDEAEDDEEESEAESEEDEEELGAVDPAFRARVAAALQVSGMDVDADADGEEDEDESDDEVWDDEQMMKVDEQLAAVFKERAGAGKKVEKSESTRLTQRDLRR